MARARFPGQPLPPDILDENGNPIANSVLTADPTTGTLPQLRGRPADGTAVLYGWPVYTVTAAA